MANRRMISKSISVSKQVSLLSTDSQLLFTWLIPHADDFGRMSADPDVVKALVLPMHKTISAERVKECIQEISKIGLIHIYQVCSESVLAFPMWESHQGNLHRRTTSKYPEPTSDSLKFPEVPGSSGLTKPNLTKPNLREENVPPTPTVEDAVSPDADLGGDVRSFPFDLLGRLNRLIGDKADFNVDSLWLSNKVREFGVVVVESAIRAAEQFTGDLDDSKAYVGKTCRNIKTGRNTVSAEGGAKNASKYSKRNAFPKF